MVGDGILFSTVRLCNVFCICFKVSTRSRCCVSGVSIDIHQKCNRAIQAHKAGTEKVSFFLVYKILITQLDLDLAKKSSNAAFQKEPLVLNSYWPALRKGQGTEMCLCLCNKQYNTPMLPMHNCFAYLSSNLWFVMTSLDPLLHCLHNIRVAFILYNAHKGINLPMEHNEVHLIIVTIITY